MRQRSASDVSLRRSFRPGARTHSSSGFLRPGVRIPMVDRPNSRHRTVPIPLWRFDMQAKRKVVSSLLSVVFSLVAGLAVAAGERKGALKAAKGRAGFSATIGSADLSKWQLIELALNPSGDPKNTKELMNAALIGKLKK